MKLGTRPAFIRLGIALSVIGMILFFSRRDYYYIVDAHGVRRQIAANFEWPFAASSWGRYSYYLSNDPDGILVVDRTFAFGFITLNTIDIRMSSSGSQRGGTVSDTNGTVISD